MNFIRRDLAAALLAGLCLILTWLPASAQSTGTIRGTVTLEDKNLPLHNVVIIITQLRKSTLTDDNGNYELKDIPAGVYSIVARMDRVPDFVRQIEIKAGETVEYDIRMKLTGIREQVNVSATGNEQTAFDAFQGVTGVDFTTLLEKDTSSLGEALDRMPGISKRSFGPGSSRPVIRGFDGDRVLIAQDGIRSGSLSYSSGDHGEPINLLSIERVEVVKGPATLLYGSNAIGGLVNAVSGHEKAHEGLRGYLSGLGSSTNNLGGGSAGIEYGTKHWMFWGNGGGQKSGDYSSPLGKVVNSATEALDFTGGTGFYSDRGFISGSYGFNRNIYGVPVDFRETNPEAAQLNPRRHNVRITGGINNLSGMFDHIHLTVDYTDYKHQELVGDQVETQFFNKTVSYRAVVEQRREGRLSGSFGVSGFRRDFRTEGAEVLTPPTVQNSFAAFTLQTLDLEKAAFQFGARVEHNGYDTIESKLARNRSFTGFSGSAGVRVPVWKGGAFSANYTHSFRAPSLDELYNFGPHPGNLTFEIGNTNLEREAADGVDVSFRQSSERLKAEVNFFYYNMRNFVYLAPTGDVEDGLPVADYKQGDSRFYGTEVDLNIGLHRNLFLNTGLDYVNAELKASRTPLPRIPPLRGRIGLDLDINSFRLNPELVMSRDQGRVFANETRTPGYAVFNLLASYTLTQQHAAHIFSVSGFNLGNKLYFNHLSFIKDIAPEIGRGVRFTYTVRFF